MANTTTNIPTQKNILNVIESHIKASNDIIDVVINNAKKYKNYNTEQKTLINYQNIINTIFNNEGIIQTIISTVKKLEITDFNDKLNSAKHTIDDIDNFINYIKYKISGSQNVLSSIDLLVFESSYFKFMSELNNVLNIISNLHIKPFIGIKLFFIKFQINTIRNFIQEFAEFSVDIVKNLKICLANTVQFKSLNMVFEPLNEIFDNINNTKTNFIKLWIKLKRIKLSLKLLYDTIDSISKNELGIEHAKKIIFVSIAISTLSLAFSATKYIIELVKDIKVGAKFYIKIFLLKTAVKKLISALEEILEAFNKKSLGKSLNFKVVKSFMFMSIIFVFMTYTFNIIRGIKTWWLKRKIKRVKACFIELKELIEECLSLKINNKYIKNFIIIKNIVKDLLLIINSITVLGAVSILGYISLVAISLFITLLIGTIWLIGELLNITKKIINNVKKRLNSINILISSLLLIGAAILLFAIATPIIVEALTDYIWPFIGLLIFSIVVLYIALRTINTITFKSTKYATKTAINIMIITGLFLVITLSLIMIAGLGSLFASWDMLGFITLAITLTTIFIQGILFISKKINTNSKTISAVSKNIKSLLIASVELLLIGGVLLLFGGLGSLFASWDTLGHILLAITITGAFITGIVFLGKLLNKFNSSILETIGSLVLVLIVAGFVFALSYIILSFGNIGAEMLADDTLINIGVAMGCAIAFIIAAAALGSTLTIALAPLGIVIALSLIAILACLSIKSLAEYILSLSGIGAQISSSKSIENILGCIDTIIKVIAKIAGLSVTLLLYSIGISGLLISIAPVMLAITAISNIVNNLIGISKEKISFENINDNIEGISIFITNITNKLSLSLKTIAKLVKFNTLVDSSISSTVDTLYCITNKLNKIQNITIDKQKITDNLTSIFTFIDDLQAKVKETLKPDEENNSNKLLRFIGLDSKSLTKKIQHKEKLKELNRIEEIAAVLGNMTNVIKNISEFKLTNDIKESVNTTIDNLFEFIENLAVKVGNMLNPNTKLESESLESFNKRKQIIKTLNSKRFENSAEQFGIISNIVTTLSGMTDAIKTLKEFKIEEQDKKNIEAVIDELFGVTNTITNKLNSYSKDAITADTTKLTEYTSTLNEFGKSFNAISGVDINKFNTNTNSFAKFLSVVNKVELDKVKSAADMFEKMSEFSRSIQGNFDKLADALSEKLLPVLEDLKEVMSEVPDKLDKGFSNTSASIGAINNAPTRDNYTAQVLREQPNLSKQQVESMVDARLNDKAKADANSMSAKLDDLISLLKGMTGENVVVKMA
jgi:hypothetical protein